MLRQRYDGSLGAESSFTTTFVNAMPEHGRAGEHRKQPATAPAEEFTVAVMPCIARKVGHSKHKWAHVSRVQCAPQSSGWSPSASADGWHWTGTSKDSAPHLPAVRAKGTCHWHLQLRAAHATGQLEARTWKTLMYMAALRGSTMVTFRHVTLRTSPVTFSYASEIFMPAPWKGGRGVTASRVPYSVDAVPGSSR